MADPTEEPAAATAPDPDPPQAGTEDEGGLSPDQRKAVERADKPDEVRALISQASRRARQAEADAKTARQELQQLHDAGKSELEKAAGRAERAETRLAELERDLLVTRVAAKHGVPAEDMDRLRGATEEELEADAKAFAKRYLRAEEPPPDLGGGARSGPATAAGSKGFSESIRRQAQRRR